MCVYYNSRKDCALIFTNINLQHGFPKQKIKISKRNLLCFR